MNTDELVAFHDNLSELLVEGREDDAREYVGQHVHRFPEEIRGEIMAEMFLQAIVDEANEIETIADFQKEGALALRDLASLKKKLEADNETV